MNTERRALNEFKAKTEVPEGKAMCQEHWSYPADGC